MVIDCRADPDKSGAYEILDAETGEGINGLSIWYADDVKGELRAYKQDARGLYIVDGDEIASETIQRKIKIVPKGWRPEPAETWRNRPALF